ncbi:MAG: LptF/LptG family permease [Leptospiraceae bacterium]|nr:LptF/LptG family permease [Leptospiraceae bacterium]
MKLGILNLFTLVKREYFPPKLIDKYIFSEFIKTFLGTLILVIGMMLIVQFRGEQKTFSVTKQPTYHILLYLLYTIPGILTFAAAPGVMFSVCFVIGQFNANKELVSILAAGVSFYRAVSTIFIFSVLLSFIVLFWSQFIARPSNNLAANELSIIQAGTGTKKDLVYQLHIKGKEGFYYIYWYDNKEKKIKGGFNYVKINSSNVPEFVLSAQSAKYNSEAKNWLLEKVEEIKFKNDLTLDSYKTFPSKEYVLPEEPEYFEKPIRSLEQMNFWELGEEIGIRKGKGMPYGELEVERQSILEKPLMCILVAIIGAIAGASTPKGGAVASLFLTIVVILGYYLLYATLKSLGDNGGINPVLAVWATPTLFACASGYLVWKFNL